MHCRLLVARQHCFRVHHRIPSIPSLTASDQVVGMVSIDRLLVMVMVVVTMVMTRVVVMVLVTMVVVMMVLVVFMVTVVLVVVTMVMVVVTMVSGCGYYGLRCGGGGVVDMVMVIMVRVAAW